MVDPRGRRGKCINEREIWHQKMNKSRSWYLLRNYCALRRTRYRELSGNTVCDKLSPAKVRLITTLRVFMHLGRSSLRKGYI
jgi:hypothetical protein